MQNNYFDTVKNEGYVDGQYTRDHNEWRRMMAAKGYSTGGGGGGANYPAFQFDWATARQQAMQDLTPYYEQKLADAKGDVELAKKYIEEDYQKGLRRSNQAYDQGQRYRQEDLATQMESHNLDVADETRNARGQLNQQGVLVGEIPQGQQGSAAPTSDYAQQYVLGPMSDRQRLRKLAIERAITRQGEVAGIEKAQQQEDFTTERNRALTEQDIQFPRTQRTLEEEKRQRAFNEVAPMKYQDAYTKYKVASGIPG